MEVYELLLVFELSVPFERQGNAVYERGGPYLYAGMIFNVSMAWLDNDCKEPAEALANLIVDAIYFK